MSIAAKPNISWRKFILLAAFLMVAAGCAMICWQICICPNGKMSFQRCSGGGDGSWTDCDCTYYTVWCDEATGLCWQDPQKDAKDPAWNYDTRKGYYGLSGPDANRYCEELVLGGYSDWRTPSIDELRTIIRGNPATETGGACPLTAGSARADDATACTGGTQNEGPGSDGCYWAEELTGTCSRNDPASIGHPLEYATSDLASDDPEWIGFVSFDNAIVGFNHLESLTEVRCVRDAPTTFSTCEDPTPCGPGQTRACDCADNQTGAQVCHEGGDCFGPCDCTGFTPTPPPDDVCPTCDYATVTITVPEQLDRQPYQLVAFFYHPDNFPPLGPPNGGTSDNQISSPDIDLGTPYVMTVQGCTYYRKACLIGEYHLYISLLMDPKVMPIPTPGVDYVWGLDQAPLMLGSGERINIEIQAELAILE